MKNTATYTNSCVGGSGGLRVCYPEANNLQKKMLRVHERVYAAGATEASGAVHLWKAQANDTYWHGRFGGIYMSHVRSAIYHHLIKAENAADRNLHSTTSWQRHNSSISIVTPRKN